MVSTDDHNPVGSGGRDAEMRLDELARRAGLPTTTVRLYRNKGLLPPPRLVGRTGYYDAGHLARLELIGRLQEQGFALAGIAKLLEAWEDGRGIEGLVGVEQSLSRLLAPHDEVVMDAAELLARFPPDSVGPDLVAKAEGLGLVEPTSDGRFRVPDRRFLETGAALVSLGVPADAVLDEWAQLVQATDAIAQRFISLFEDHLLPADWQSELTSEEAAELARTLSQLRRTAGQVVVAALDSSLANQGTDRLGSLIAGAV